MQEISYVITDELGVHARPAAELIKLMNQYASGVTISKDDKTVEGKGIIGLMSLGIKQGETIRITVEGDDEDAASDAINDFLKNNL